MSVQPSNSRPMAALCLLACALVALSACDKPADHAATAETPAKVADAGVTAQAPGPPTLTVPAREVVMGEGEGARQRYPNTAGSAVDAAIYQGAYAALQELSRKLDPQQQAHAGAPSGPTGAVEDQRPKGTLLSLWHSSNVRGEREDCGCKKNPRGGLTRKATLIKNAATSGRELDRPDAQLIVDAGDLLFAGVFVGQLHENDRMVAKLRAEAIVGSFNEIGCDGFVPGEYDLALGVEGLMALQKQAKFPFISANLRRAGEKSLLLKPYTVTQKAGMKVLIVGVTNPNSGSRDHYSLAKVEVDDPTEALKAQAEAIRGEKADVVILLSNLGIETTATLLQAIDRETLPVAAAIVSGTARATYEPVWAGGAPMFESGNRGKALGKVDMHIVDGVVAFQPAEATDVRQVRDYMNAYRSLHNARRAVSNLSVALDSAPPPAVQADAGALAARDKAAEERAERIRKNLDLAVERLAKIEELLPAKIDMGNAGATASKSWLHPQLVWVEIEVAQDPRVRKLIDGYEKQASAYLPQQPK